LQIKQLIFRRLIFYVQDFLAQRPISSIKELDKVYSLICTLCYQNAATQHRELALQANGLSFPMAEAMGLPPVSLKDPASRQIRYTALPWGSLVCGTVNAKNSFGGFTGAQPFVIYFTEQQRIGHFKVYTDKEVQQAKLTVSGRLDEAIEKVLVEACHL
jgi:hypothetical protein